MHEDDGHLFAAIRSGRTRSPPRRSRSTSWCASSATWAGSPRRRRRRSSRPACSTRCGPSPRRSAAQDDEYSPLSPREIEILGFVSQGLSNKEIASILHISDQTVKNNITSILRKLHVNDRTQAVIYALRHGWIDLGGEEAV